MSSSSRLIPLVLALSLQVAVAAPTTAPSHPQSQADFMRLVDKGTTGSRLETADVAYRNNDGVTVHLVSAVLGARNVSTPPFPGLHDVVEFGVPIQINRIRIVPGTAARDEGGFTAGIQVVVINRDIASAVAGAESEGVLIFVNDVVNE